MSIVLALQILGQAASDLGEDQADKWFGPVDFGGRYHEVECNGFAFLLLLNSKRPSLAEAGEIVRSRSACQPSLGVDHIAICEGQRRHHRGVNLCGRNRALAEF